MMRKYIVFILMIVGGFIWWIFSNDYNRGKPTEFYLIDSNINDAGWHEIFVVHNAPYDTSEIKRIIEIFNLETLSVDSIKKYRVHGRTFYRETKYMTRNFKEGNEYNPIFNSWDNVQDFRNHEHDILAVMSYYISSIDERVCYSYWLNWPYDYKKDDKYSNEVNIVFCNLDSFYQVNKEKYNIK